MTALGDLLDDAGGLDAPRERDAQLRTALEAALARGRAELAKPRSGTTREPVEAAFAATPDHLWALLPVDPALRADPDAAPERAWLLVAAAVGALVEAAALPPPTSGADLRLEAGAQDGSLALGLPARDGDPELAAVAFEEATDPIDRLRAAARPLPGRLASPSDPKPPIGADHPLRAAEALARLGGRPADPASAEELEDAVLAVLGGGAGTLTSPHKDPDPARRVARRIVQRLAGMGKWGGYHTAFEHLARGFAGNDRELAFAVGEALLAAGLLEEKPSVGQRHVFLNPRRAGDIYALRDDGVVPPGLRLP
jgi:hypothetical protein